MRKIYMKEENKEDVVKQSRSMMEINSQNKGKGDNQENKRK